MSDVRDVHIPKMGPGTVEADLISLEVSVGDRVSAGQEIAEVEGEKAAFMVEAPIAGTITEILLEPGQTYAIGDVICRIEPGP